MSPRTDIVTAYIPITVFGVVIDLERQVEIRPACDQACPGNVGGIVADVAVEDFEQKARPVPSADATAILAMIKRDQPEVWSEITAKAEENHLDGARAA